MSGAASSVERCHRTVCGGPGTQSSSVTRNKFTDVEQWRVGRGVPAPSLSEVVLVFNRLRQGEV